MDNHSMSNLAPPARLLEYDTDGQVRLSGGRVCEARHRACRLL